MNKQQNAALEAERVAYKQAVNAQTEHKLSASFLKGAEWGWQARAQLAAPAGVVLPERKPANFHWNECIEEVKRLNAAPAGVPDGSGNNDPE